MITAAPRKFKSCGTRSIDGCRWAARKLFSNAAPQAQFSRAYDEMPADIPFMDIDLGKPDLKALKRLANALDPCVRKSLDDGSEESIDGLRMEANRLMDSARESMSEAGAAALDRAIDKQPGFDSAAKFAMALDNITTDCRVLISRKQVYLSEI
jgi:hypothetical protein